MSDIYASTARIVTKKNDEEAMSLIRALPALDKTVFDEESSSPFVFSAQISNNNLDAYFTRMSKSSLKNYAKEAKRGVSFQNSHNCFELGFGRSFNGEFSEEGEALSVRADFYTLPGLALNGVSTDDLIRGIRAGLISDVSIGFYGGRFVCDLCGLDMMRDWDCVHIPGIEYDVADKKDKSIKKITLATATVEDAHLSEVSAVYDGATPGAAIVKAQAELNNGRITPKQLNLLESRYRINLRRDSRAYEIQTEDNKMDKFEIDIEQVRSIAKDAGIKSEVNDPLEGIRALANEVKRLQPLAADGEEYRRDLTEDALKECVRAGLTSETYKPLLTSAPLATIRSMRDEWKKKGDEILPTGRQTVDGDESQPAEQIQRTPSAAYAT